MVELTRKQVSEMHFEKFPNPSTFQRWKPSFKTEVCSCSSFPTDAMLWIKEVEMVGSVADLETSQSIGGRRFPKLEMLDAKMASALKRSSSTPTSRKESICQSKRINWMTEFSVEYRLLV